LAKQSKAATARLLAERTTEHQKNRDPDCNFSKRRDRVSVQVLGAEN
jgi:hypothetical protein